jgi:protein O-GlcNAc transferase
MRDEDLLQSAIEFHKSNDLAAAAELYQEVLRRDPKHRHALYMFGCLSHDAGNHLAAAELFRRSLAVSPKDPECYNALGLALMELGNYDEAESNIRRAIRLSSRPWFHNSLGTLRKKQGRIQEAMAAYKHALKQDANFADAHYNVGNCYRLTGELEQAAESFRLAVAANATFGAALASLGQTFRSLNRSMEAIPYLEQALALAPQDSELNCVLGDALQDLGQLSRAIRAYENALSLNPCLARAWYALGCAELAQKEYAPAIASFEKALSGEPGWLEAEHNLARALFEMGQIDEAMAHFRNCAARDDFRNSALARAMLALIIPGAPGTGNAEILEVRRSWAEHDLPRPAARAKDRFLPESDDRPIRIGYISSFFHRENWMKPVWGLINQHDRSEFEIHLFSGAPASKIQRGWRGDPRDHFHDITRASNEDVKALMEHCAIDLLVDLNSYSDMARLPLFNMRPAPVIIGWFNLYATSGLECFDYLIGDSQVMPAEEERFYTERIRRVPSSYLTFEVNYPVPEVADPPCLWKHAITFGSLASQNKITDRVAAAWSSILLESPGSSLIVKNSALGCGASREFLYNLFARNGVPRERLILDGPAEHFEFLKAYDQIDIALDTFPYNGGTTTTEAIWQGAPVLTFWGDRWVSRTSASILRAGGLGEFVRADLSDYISFAAELANSPGTPERLLTLRREMRSQLMNSPVCDTGAFARELENIYKQIHRAGIEWRRDP